MTSLIQKLKVKGNKKQFVCGFHYHDFNNEFAVELQWICLVFLDPTAISHKQIFQSWRCCVSLGAAAAAALRRLACWNCSKHNSCHFNQKFSLICPQTISPTARSLVPVIFGRSDQISQISRGQWPSTVGFSAPCRCKHTQSLPRTLLMMDSYHLNSFSVSNCTLADSYLSCETLLFW